MIHRCRTDHLRPGDVKDPEDLRRGALGVPLATYGSYEAVRDLDHDAQRQLLTDGDRAERIWAAWALTAILGGQAAPDILASGDLSLSAGIRRQLLVVLAGLGETLIIRTLAEGDPSPVVRASGCQYLMQIRQHDDAESADFLRFCLFTDLAAEVRDEILKSPSFDQLELDLEQLVALAHDPSERVRGRVVAVVHDRYPPAEIAASGLYKRLAVEDRRGLLLELGQRAMTAGGAERLLPAAEAQTTEGAVVLLDLLVGAEARFAWPPLNALASRRDPAIDLRVLRLLSPGSGPVALSWLAYSIASRLSQEGVPDWDFIEAAWEPLTDSLDGVPAAAVLQIRPNLETIIRYAESIPDPEPAETEAGDRRLYFADLRRKLAALIASAAAGTA